MLQAIPKGVFSYSYQVLNNGVPVVDIDQSWFREAGTFSIHGYRYTVRKQSMMGGTFVLERDGVQIITAQKPNAFTRTFTFEYEGMPYSLKPRSAFTRGFMLFMGNEQIGQLMSEGVFNRKLRADLPQQFPLPVQMFLIWLVLLMWRREDQSTATAAAASG